MKATDKPLTDSEKLLNLAKWFDIQDKRTDTRFRTEVQDDLRRIAEVVESQKEEIERLKAEIITLKQK